MKSSSNIWWIGPLVLTLLRLLYAEARSRRATSNGDVLVFRAAIGLRILIGVGVSGFTVLILTSIGQEETWLLVMGAALVIVGCLAWPPTITISDKGVQRTVWWRTAVTIPWDDVSGIERNGGGEKEVFGAHGQSITFTRFHVDPARFVTEVTRRANLKSVSDASAPPSLHP